LYRRHVSGIHLTRYLTTNRATGAKDLIMHAITPNNVASVDARAAYLAEYRAAAFAEGRAAARSFNDTAYAAAVREVADAAKDQP
jgi:hypothetical protein